MNTPKFFTSFLIYSTPNLLLTYIILALPIPQPEAVFISNEPWRREFHIISICVLGPMIETALLLGPTVVVSKLLSTKNAIVALIGCTPVVLLHISMGWTKIIIVFWGFFWSSYWYLMIRKKESMIKHPILQVLGLHMLGNTLAMIFVLLEKK